MKKKSFRTVIIVLLVVAVFFAIYLGLHYASSVNINNRQEIVNYVRKEEKNQNVEILATEANDHYGAVFYMCNDKKKLLVFTQNFIYGDRYDPTGSSSYSSGLETFCVITSGENLLLIVFGHNPDKEAFSYEFFVGRERFYSTHLDENIVDVYYLEGRNTSYTGSKVFNDSGELLDLFDSINE